MIQPDPPTFALPQRRHVVTELPGPRSRALAKRRNAVVADGVSTVLGAYIAEAAGAVLVDVDGNSLIDMGSGIAVTGIGHAVPAVIEAITQAATRFTHTCFMVAPYEGYVEVCERLAALTPGDFPKASVLVNSGAEAVENAVKIARRATGRQAIVVFDHAYHGRTNLTMALTAKNMPYKDGFGPFAAEIYRVPMSYPFRDPAGLSGPDAAARALRLVETQVGADRVAAILVEPIQGEGGFVVPAPGFLPALAGWCSDHGAVFIADEVQTGFCRTGQWFACQHEGVVPDLLTFAKGMAGGLPLGAVTGRADLVNAVHRGGLGGTFSGNPVSCAAALATLEVMADWDLPAAARQIEAITLPRLVKLQDRFAGIGDVRGRGAMLAVELVRPGSLEPDPVATQAVAATCHAAGVVVLTCGSFNNVIRLLPPLVIEPDLLDDALGVFEGAVEAALASR